MYIIARKKNKRLYLKFFKGLEVRQRLKFVRHRN